MKATIESGCVRIDISDLLQDMTTEDKRSLADELSLQDDIIEDVVSQIMEGWTAAGNHGWIDSDKAEPSSALGKAIRRVALGADAVAAREVEKIVATLKWLEALRSQTEEWAWEMHRMMNEANRQGIISPPAPSCPSVTGARPGEYAVVRKPDSIPLANRLKAFRDCWYARNPVHETNADSGEDMFWKTALMVAEDFLLPTAPDQARLHPMLEAGFSGGRCPTCRQRNSRVREHQMDDGSVTVWHCNVAGCSNHVDYTNAESEALT